MTEIAMRALALDFRYETKGPWIVDGFTNTFHAGEMTALTGPSGGGKSTLLYLLAGLLSPTKGEIQSGNTTVSSLNDWQRSGFRAANYGFVFQDAMLDPSRTVLDNVCESAVISGWTRKSAISAASRLLAEFGLEHRKRHRPGEVSGGQAQRVAMCRALITEPRVIFADEPTGNLDPQSANVVLSALEKAAGRGACVLIATHSQQVTARCDRHIQISAHSNSLRATS